MEMTYKLRSFHWWLVGIALVAAFGFFVPNFWDMVGPMNDDFVQKINTAWVVGTLNPYLMVKIIRMFCTLRWWGHKNTTTASTSAHYEPPGETFTT